MYEEFLRKVSILGGFMSFYSFFFISITSLRNLKIDEEEHIACV